jgi:hypothetical protein
MEASGLEKFFVLQTLNKQKILPGVAPSRRAWQSLA